MVVVVVVVLLLSCERLKEEIFCTSQKVRGEILIFKQARNK